MDTDALAAPVLEQCIDTIVDQDLSVTDVPLLGLDPELSNPPERQLLFAEGMPYAILLEPDYPFDEVMRPLDDDDDVLEEGPVVELFRYFKPDRDRTQPQYLAIRALSERRKSARKVPEFLIEVPTDDEAHYFVCWPGLLPSASHDERLSRALELAERAAERLDRPPSQPLRMHEFHHAHDETYFKIMRIVDRGNLLRGGKSPGDGSGGGSIDGAGN